MFIKRYIKVFLFILFFAPLFNIELIHASESITSEINPSWSLEEKINKIFEDERLQGSITGISVRKADTGEEIYSHHGNIRLHPASNMKILTASTALEVLGPDHKFKTKVYTDGELVGGVLKGNLYIQGGGDPTLLKEDIDELVNHLKKLEVRKVEGDLVADDTWYDNIRLSQDLNWSDEPFHTGAQISALTLSPDKDYDAGTVMLEIIPGKRQGDVAQVNVIPNTDYVKVLNQTRTVHKDEKKQLTIDRVHGENTIIVEGDIPIGTSKEKTWVAVWDPTSYVLNIFASSLKSNGISFSSELEQRLDAVPKDATLLVENQSMPLKELLLPFMKLSNNTIGEVLVKEMGKAVHGEGSWEKGLAVMEESIINLGMDPNLFLLRDGSGMSHKNFVSSSELTKLLYEIQQKDWFTVFENSLPVAGESEKLVGGTLRSRMDNLKGNVRAKTGSITGVQTLSGYVTNINGEKLIFSILNNNYIEDSMSAIQDTMVTILATHNLN
ncbi:D-alanyl-D-alanine carboxypeptidase/D-alanyl-D-alanine-endopeptidase [Oceanobacillus sp. Castelsardo]|uniref:D-alanyl-D-alanine carboxypeptidase/D-alanyl-D-alanine endopeptidase n=1 Tax=Oceanobacillus sp. Castelsardo TaxID=1851204 RepID=UPI0008393A20|nr:D-alanyl-D-alanine carboxypeptidase/D-alanyl-D-alanine-endopeptidase [Oceanobacillus sp. Castelsardo]